MATQSVLPAVSHVLKNEVFEDRLSREEGWDLLFSLYGSAQKMYSEYGGGEAWLRSERAAWTG